MPTRPAHRDHRAGRLGTLVPLTVAALLAGCSPDPAPAVTPPAASASAAPSPTLPSPAPSPTQPAEMARDDEAGAVAAVQHFLRLYAYTEEAQDTSAWEAMSHPNCVFCKSVLDDVTARRLSHQVTYPTPMLVTATTVDAISPLAYTVTVDVATGPDALWSRDGVLLDPGTTEHGRMTLVMVNQRNAWLVREVQLDRAA